MGGTLGGFYAFNPMIFGYLQLYVLLTPDSPEKDPLLYDRIDPLGVISKMIGAAIVQRPVLLTRKQPGTLKIRPCALEHI